MSTGLRNAAAVCAFAAVAGTLAVAAVALAQNQASAPGGSARAIDLIVEGDYVLTMRPGAQPMRAAAIAIDDGRILDIGTQKSIRSRYAARETIDGTDRVVMPGLINGHTHAAMTLLRGIADDLALMDWLNNFIFPAEVRFVDADFVRVGTELACWEMIRGGTTTFVDMYYFPDAVAEAVEDCGMRAVVVPSVIEQPSPDAKDGEQSLRQAIDFAQRWRGRVSRIVPAIGAHSVYTLTPEWLAKVRTAAFDADVPVSIHLAESPYEIEVTREKYDQTPAELLDGINFFDNKVIAAHVVYPTASDQVLLSEHRVGVIHNPTSNMKIASGVAPVADMIANGLLVGLGTDGAASNNDLDLWEEIRLAALLQKVSEMDPTVLPAPVVLDMATRGGAAAIGLGDSIGTLEPGKRADVIQVSLTSLRLAPIYDVVSHLVYVTDSQDVVTTVVDGEILMRDAEVLTLDEARIRREALAIQRRIVDGLAESRD
jgi:5-methylthioadenosine/S-adenosylhomocysteine deaminase